MESRWLAKSVPDETCFSSKFPTCALIIKINALQVMHRVGTFTRLCTASLSSSRSTSDAIQRAAGESIP